MKKALSSRLSVAAVACVILFASNAALADKPAWQPVAEILVSSVGLSDPTRLSDVMNRCTALNMTMSSLVSEDSPDLSQSYKSVALNLVQSGIIIESRLKKEMTGEEADVDALVSTAIATVRELLHGYSDWLDDNYAHGGSYFNDEFETEMKACQLASRLVIQMQGG